MPTQWNPAIALADVADNTETDTTSAYARLLDECPVGRIDVHGTWGIFGYDEVLAAVTDVKTFSSVTPVAGATRMIPLESDPPEHTPYRRMINPFFTAEKMAELERDIRPFAGQMLDQLVGQGPIDFVAQFANPFPVRTLCKFLGVPDDDWQIINDWHRGLVERSGRNEPGRPKRDALFQEIMPYLLSVIQERRLALRDDDIISAILSGNIDGDPLPDEAVIGYIILLLVAGHETTTNALTSIVFRLAQDQEFQGYLRAHQERIPDAIEESLRIDSPTQAMQRKCLRDVEIGGELIKAGDYVHLNYGSANVDPSHWTDPATFDVDRADKRHLAFGRGVHQCFGAPLARLQIRVVLEELLTRTAAFSVAGEVHRHTWPSYGSDKLVLSLEAVS
ncbi:MAG: cytochrome P450 [Actinomycetota bacterium]|nr:cytochrome P450 [Actinomycetota bacterium]